MSYPQPASKKLNYTNKQNTRRLDNKFNTSQNWQEVQSTLVRQLSGQKTRIQRTLILSHSENLKFRQTLDYLRQRHQKFEEYQSQSYADLQDMEKSCQEKCNKIYEQLQQLHAAVNLEQKQKFESTQKATGKFMELQSLEIVPIFTNLREEIKKAGKKNKEQLGQLEDRMLGHILGPVKQEQKSRGTVLLDVLNNSIFRTEQIQIQMEELDKWSDKRLADIENKLQQLQHETLQCLRTSQESRQREDKLIEQLIEKVIYKMTYL